MSPSLGLRVKWLALHPNFVGDNVVSLITHSLVLGNGHFAGNRFNDAEQFVAEAGIIFGLQVTSLDFINEAALAVWSNRNSCPMRIVLDRFVPEVDDLRGEEDEQQNQGHHDIVL